MRSGIGSMEPMLPEEAELHRFEDLTFELIQKASGFSGSLHPETAQGVGTLVRSMNCYYSNLIEDHNTHPLAIDRAMAGSFDEEPEKRNLQLEAKAHIEVQRAVDAGEYPEQERLVSRDFLTRLHREFCERLPDELLWAERPGTDEKLRVIPGVFRDHDVRVGRHVPPDHASLDAFMARFEEAYRTDRLSKTKQLIAIAASHHRLAWIHPFLDGNGRVSRLFSHAWLREIGIGSTLWSVSRGLARTRSSYKALLQAADEPRRGDRDGRGNLSQVALIDFCIYFLESCIDQVDYMQGLLRAERFTDRLEAWSARQVREGLLPDRSYRVLREAFLAGSVDRSSMMDITGLKDRAARDVLYKLLKAELLVADGSRGPVRLGFPVKAAMEWFPRLYPEDIQET